jgi:hypothetical protein
LKIRVCFLFVLFVLFTQCKKYPEDNFISLKTSERRLTKYKWKIETIKYEGQVVNDQYNDSLVLGELKDLEFEFSGANGYDESIYNIRYTQNSNFHTYGHYIIMKKYESFSFHDHNTTYDSIKLKEESVLNNLFCTKTWSILKLYRKEFKIKNFRNYVIEFKAFD